MKVIGYIRVSTDKQDFEQQKYALLDYAQKHKMTVEQFIELEMSSRKSKKERRIEELQSILEPEDTLLVTELSRLGRNMLEILGLLQELSESKIKMVFTQQPELSTTGSHGKLLLAIYGYFAETEREFISIRTKQGLAAAKAKGKQLGRPKGSKNKKARTLDPYKEQIKRYLELNLNIGAIQKLVNPYLEKPLSYQSFKYHIEKDAELSEIKKIKKKELGVSKK